eukprot:TRINITY_DN11464_c0_g1_i1.p1 TRINITY_DN11464_c0_g1~~TRINITY_DN11464_c0_g1_i1.p1  ORF type:complete len:324 (-),score=59.44 TRINITY_DN11464_c0_g1_i1:157-1098(-)
MTDKTFIPYDKRPEWADLKGIPQDDGPKPVVPIAYSDEFRSTMDYFRAVLHKDERSKRAFDLTTEVIGMNPANYTVWHFRRLCIEAIKDQIDLRQELEFVTEVALDNPKNYQIWHHRKCVVELLQDSSAELEFSAELIDDDSKNYHAWSYRQWALKRFNLWEGEMKYTDKLIKQDWRNNSAWNQRYFVLQNTGGMNVDTITQEISYAISIILKAPNNPSPWNYMKGLINGRLYATFPDVEKFCLEATQRFPACANPYPILIDIACEKKNAEDAAKYCTKLAEELDQVHKKYWIWRREQIEAGKLVGTTIVPTV